MKQAYRVAAAYVGAVVGAGFASGQETVTFFTVHGTHGIKGLIVAGLLFSLLGFLTIKAARASSCYSHQALLRLVLGRPLGTLVSFLFSLFLLAGLSVMLAGSRTVVQEYMGIPGWLGLGVCLGTVLLALLRRNRGLMDLNAFLVPVLLVATLLVCWPAAASGVTPAPQAYRGNWLLSSLLYFSYNSIIGMAVLAPLAREASPVAGLLGGLALGAAGLCIGLALIRTPEALGLEVPMMHLALAMHPLVGWLYGIGLWAAMTTTAMAGAYATSLLLSDSTRIPFPCAATLVLLAALPLGTLRFSHLVATLYPLWGYLGLACFMAGLASILFTMGRTHPSPDHSKRDGTTRFHL
ncbi:MAG: hypothetical protein AB1576_12745 [Bacillota bacterium]